MKLSENESGDEMSSARLDLPGITSMADLEERIRILHTRAGTPNPAQVHKLSKGEYEISKSTAGRWQKPWNGREPSLNLVLGLISAYGVPERDMSLWRAAYGQAKKGGAPVLPTPEQAASGWRRGPVLLGSAAIALIILGLVAWSTFGAEGQRVPEQPPATASVPQITTPGPLNPNQLNVFKPAQRLALPLIANWAIPQQPFDLDRFEVTAEPDVWDMAIECRPVRCPKGEGRFYTVLSTPGISFIAVVDGSAVDDPQPCVGAKYQSGSVPLTTERLYCVRTANRLALFRALELPHDVPADQVLVTLEAAAWSLG